MSAKKYKIKFQERPDMNDMTCADVHGHPESTGPVGQFSVELDGRDFHILVRLDDGMAIAGALAVFGAVIRQDEKHRKQVTEE